MQAPSIHRGGSGEPMVLLHGFTLTWRGWEPVLPALEERFDVLVPALPGHLGGERFTPGAAVTMETMADVLERRLDEQGIGRAHLVGNSLGGWLSFELARRGRALSVVGLCPAGGWEHGSAEERAVYKFFWRSSRVVLPALKPFFEPLARRPRLRELALGDLVARPRQMDAALALATLEAAAGCAVAADLLAASKRGNLFGAELGAIDCPVTIAPASGDRLFHGPSYFVRFRRLLPEASWVELDGLGHVPMSDDPDRVLAAILAGTAES